MNGPKPVCTSARKKINQSSPRRLSLEGLGFATRLWTGAGTTSVLPTARGRSPSSGSCEWSGRAVRMSPPSMFMERCKGGGLAQHHDRRVLLVFGRGGDLSLGQFQRDAVLLVGDVAEMEGAPVDHDLAAADTEKAAEIDHGRS